MQQFRIVRGECIVNVEVSDYRGTSTDRFWIHVFADDDAVLRRTLHGPTVPIALAPMD